jgi:TonB family protein
MRGLLAIVMFCLSLLTIAQAQETNKPFDISQEKLPVEYQGYEPSEIKRALHNRERQLKKDEFETTEQYLARKKEEESRPLIGSVKIDSKLAFKFSFVRLLYDADRQVMNAEIPFGSSYNLKFDYLTRYGDSWEIQNKSDFDFRESTDFGEKMIRLETEIKMDIQTAKQSKPYIQAIAVFTLVEPYLSRDSFNVIFHVKLEEIWFYEITSGRIISKLTPKKIIEPNVANTNGTTNTPETKAASINREATGPTKDAAPQTTSKSKIFNVGSLMDYVDKQYPARYPQDAKAEKVQGVVAVELVIDEQGDVISAQCKSGPKMLCPTALEAAKRWKFKPYLIDDKPVRMSGVISFNFIL